MILVNLEEAETILNNDRSMSIDLTEHNAKVRADAIEEYSDILTHNFMKMIAEHTIGEILDKSYEQIKEQKNEL